MSTVDRMFDRHTLEDMEIFARLRRFSADPMVEADARDFDAMKKRITGRVQWKHRKRVHFGLERFVDKCVFGTWRATTVRTFKKAYRIHDGEVQIKFRGRWRNVEESRPEVVDGVRKHCVWMALATESKTWHGLTGWVHLA